ncbi:hypothetical protein MYG64_26350 (plasmid) [Ensifer adhaerens]|uniref:hypothetical protein n=1 Tax=Ensifer adhaerens TaxID=106592 RepID=UPI002101BCDD|nr:hypothetical protein [Ensifer adhaerens]UTV39248.1 hypothetical protein MYG64_26350 [Ensifer adhaerens]
MTASLFRIQDNPQDPDHIGRVEKRDAITLTCACHSMPTAVDHRIRFCLALGDANLVEDSADRDDRALKQATLSKWVRCSI